jgi:hypothetical protein
MRTIQQRVISQGIAMKLVAGHGRFSKETTSVNTVLGLCLASVVQLDIYF